MRLILNAGPLPERYKKVVAAIGVFDGLHRGHQQVIASAVAAARAIKGTSMVVTFFPHPVAVLHPVDFNGYVVSLEHRIRLIKDLGVDVCYVVPFTKAFSRRSAESFVRGVLKERLRVVKVAVGTDFHFGCQRRGSTDLFSKFGIGVEAVPIIKLNNINIKTKFIKQLVAEGDLRRVKSFLGRDYGMLAEVERGQGVGRRLGFPTANLKWENVITLPSGIYIVRVSIGEKKFNGVFYIGSRPTFAGQPKRGALEAHVFDYKGNLYGKVIGVDFLKKIRDDHAFPDERSLSQAIARDVRSARLFFMKNPLQTIAS
ncbi:MAG: riboflavin biosynthesis protein RibF [Candidatus Omnitrophota bacterium]